MINGLGIVGWGVGGIEAEAGMLGQPVYFLTPDVVGVHLTGSLREGVTATDLALTVTEMLRKAKVVGKFVEFFGPGAAALPVVDRATIANMAPEYGATMGFFPIDAECVNYLRATGRSEEHCRCLRKLLQGAGLVRHSEEREDRVFAGVGTGSGNGRAQRGRTETSAGQDRIAEFEGKFHRGVQRTRGGKRLWQTAEIWQKHFSFPPDGGLSSGGGSQEPVSLQAAKSQNGTNPFTELEMANNRPTPDLVATPVRTHGKAKFGNGSVLIAAITSCTNTSNPSVMLAAGCLRKKPSNADSV
jgi:aconitate hydratase